MDLIKANPFVSRMNIAPLDRLKLIVGLVVLMPFRLVLVMALVVLSSLVGYLLVLVTTITGHRELTYAQSLFKRICLDTTTSIFALAMFIAEGRPTKKRPINRVPLAS